MFQNYHNSQSRSASRHRSTSRPRNEQWNIFEVVRFINNIESGCTDLRTVRNFMFRHVDTKSNSKFRVVWKILTENKDNFKLNDQMINPDSLNGNETVWVRTNLGLCRIHCRRGKDGRNRACDGDCGALHVCRTFLLLSNTACPFNNKKQKCMFGHTFREDHNVELLREHNLLGLHDEELQRLFRRRPSRSANTMPELCIYYNKASGKKCSRDNCKALHLCSDFIQQRCQGHCSRNHKLTTPQVGRILDLFGIYKSSWSPDMLLDDLRHFMTARHRNNTGGNDSDEDSDVSSVFSEPMADLRTRKPSSYFSEELIDSPSAGQMPRCAECEDLKRVVNRMQIKMSCLTSQVTELKTEMATLNSRMTAIDGIANKESEKEFPGNDSTMSVDETEPKFVRSQVLPGLSGVPPNSSQFGGTKRDLDQLD